MQIAWEEFCDHTNHKFEDLPKPITIRLSSGAPPSPVPLAQLVPKGDFVITAGWKCHPRLMNILWSKSATTHNNLPMWTNTLDDTKLFYAPDIKIHSLGKTTTIECGT